MNERPDTERIKAQLAADVVRIIAEQKLTDEQACARLGVSGPELGGLRSTNTGRFSIEQLVGFLNALDRQVQVNVRAGASTHNPLQALVEYAEEVSSRIPAEDLDRLPTDMAANIDHYLYGSPRRD